MTVDRVIPTSKTTSTRIFSMESPASTSRLVSQAEFARLAGVSRQYVNKLVSKGRIQLIDGKVNVDQASAAIKEDADPARSMERETAAARLEQTAPIAQPLLPTPGSLSAPAEKDLSAAGITSFQVAKTIQQKYSALREKLAYEKEIGQLCETAEVIATVRNMAATLRAALERLPGRLAGDCAALTDQAQIYRRIEGEVHHILNEMANLADELAGQLTETD